MPLRLLRCGSRLVGSLALTRVQEPTKATSTFHSFYSTLLSVVCGQLSDSSLVDQAGNINMEGTGPEDFLPKSFGGANGGFDLDTQMGTVRRQAYFDAEAKKGQFPQLRALETILMTQKMTRMMKTTYLCLMSWSSRPTPGRSRRLPLIQQALE